MARIVPPPQAAGVDEPPEADARGALPGASVGSEAPDRFWTPSLLIVAPATVGALILVLNFGKLRDRFLGNSAGLRIQSVAVLPFDNLTGDRSQDYLVEGMTDALTTEVAQIKALRVTSRTSAMQYQGMKKPLPQIGRELNVDAVVEGTLRRAGDRVWITAQLIEASSDRHLWAKPYEGHLPGLDSLQNQMAGHRAGDEGRTHDRGTSPSDEPTAASEPRSP